MRGPEIEKKEIMSLIEGELENINQLLQEMGECRGNDKISRRAKGSILHDFYNGCERIFEIIARRINGGMPNTEQWHRILLHQMTIEIKEVRPPVISKKLAAELADYLSFRHLFRNIYGFELESDRLDRLVEKFENVIISFKKEILDFVKKL